MDFPYLRLTHLREIAGLGSDELGTRNSDFRAWKRGKRADMRELTHDDAFGGFVSRKRRRPLHWGSSPWLSCPVFCGPLCHKLGQLLQECWKYPARLGPPSWGLGSRPPICPKAAAGSLCTASSSVSWGASPVVHHLFDKITEWNQTHTSNKHRPLQRRRMKVPEEGSVRLTGTAKSSLANWLEVAKKELGQKLDSEAPRPWFRGIRSAKIAPPHILTQFPLTFDCLLCLEEGWFWLSRTCFSDVENFAKRCELKCRLRGYLRSGRGEEVYL